MGNTNFRNLLDFEGLDRQANTQDSDFKAEVIAANLIEKGYDSSKILLVREGAGRRGFAKDIEEISLQFSEHDLSDYLHIKTNREGIYDILPEGVFHRTVNRRLNKDKEDMLDEIRIHREEEFFARKFFRLFEIELDNLLIEMTLFETEFDKRITHPNYVNVFLPCWQVLQLLEREQAVIFLYIIPIIHRIRNSYREIEESLSLILEVPVHLENVILEKKDAGGFFESELGKSRLGVDFIPGNTFNDGQYDIKMRIGAMSALRMKAFLKDGTSDRILSHLCRLFLPGNVFVVREYIIDPRDSAFILSTDRIETYLGINSFV
ncbi:MAG: type VI secretion system baseplate subunit TssG [Tannerellaceae bacterium]|jgi:hypothetical protein|nr:type VI secretion system baseplate subunit TssG [Tannerellaceae bacterium]